MPDTIPNLWPEEFKVNVQSPLTILRAQAVLLGKVTRGILAGTVETEIGKEKVQHRLVVIAPAYNGYRHTLIVASHNPDLPYPAEVRAQGLELQRAIKPNSILASALGTTYETYYPSASDDTQMQALVQQALRSDATRSVILSLIAKSNEAVLPPSFAPQSGSSEAVGAS